MGCCYNNMVKMKTILIIGAYGGLGIELSKLFTDYNVLMPTSKELDITKDIKQFFIQNKIDIVINLAAKKNDMFLHEAKDYKSMIDVNINGLINLFSAVLPEMRKNKYGRIITFSSVFSVLNVREQGIYSASKSFVDKIVQIASLENISYGITCNSIQLGYYADGMGSRTTKENIEKAKNKIGLKRFCSINEIYNTIKFLIETEYITGQNIRIDGGL